MMTSEGLYKGHSDAEMDGLPGHRPTTDGPSPSEPHTADERDDDLMLGAIAALELILMRPSHCCASSDTAQPCTCAYAVVSHAIVMLHKLDSAMLI